MQLFTQLYTELDATNRTNEKVAALERYFAAAPPADAAWALSFLIGRRQRRALSGSQLRDWVSDETGLPLWLVEESYSAVGDIAETLALLLRQSDFSTDDEVVDSDAVDPTPFEQPLREVVEERLLPLPNLNEAEQHALVVDTWRRMSTAERFVYHKLITGEFRVGVGRTLVVRALANVVGIDRAVMEHRIMGSWSPSTQAYLRLVDPDTTHVDHTRPYPFYLAYQLDDAQVENLDDALGDIDNWQIEWKWDGIRAQMIRREGDVLIWTRGEELVTDVYPEVEAVGAALPEGTVLDGELIAWRDEEPLSFNVMQTRIGRKTVTKKLLAEAPVVLIAYDLLEWEGEDLREQPLSRRRALLADLVNAQPSDLALRLSPTVTAQSWADAASLRDESRARKAEGFMIKRRDAPYGVGRKKGDWWKWKIDPFTLDAVMIYAQRGSGRRASLYSDYTFAVWDDEGELVPVTKAYSGLTDEEMRQVDAWVRRNTNDRFGPVRQVTPEQVFEIGFEGIQASNRHKSGVALRFPRMLRWRRDLGIKDADTLSMLKGLLAEVEG